MTITFAKAQRRREAKLRDARNAPHLDWLKSDVSPMVEDTSELPTYDATELAQWLSRHAFGKTQDTYEGTRDDE